MKENKISRRSFLKFGAAASAVGMMAAAPVAANAAQPDADAAADEENCLLGLFQKPKYIFLFIGDGMGTAQIQSARFYKGTVDNNGAVTEADLSFTGFPTVGSVTTYDSTSFCPDSASTATAIATGHKTESGVINMCPWTRDVPYETIAEKLHAQKGYKVGIISSVNIDHATPAAFYAHQKTRKNYYQIGVELANSGFEYFAGGEFQKVNGDGTGPNNHEVAAQAGYNVVTTQAGAAALTAGAGKTLIIAENLADGKAMNYAMDAAAGEWQLTDYVKKGIELLDNPKGFFLMTESGKIDWACHANDAAASIHDVLEMSNAVQAAVEFQNKHPNDTLILVTADHETGGMAIGYKTTNYDTFLTNLTHQKMSYAKFDSTYVQNYIANKTPFEAAMQDVKVVPRDVVTACAPQPKDIGDEMTGKMLVGVHCVGKKDGKKKEYFLYQPFDNQESIERWGTQAVTAQTGFGAALALELIGRGIWKEAGVYAPEYFDPKPYLELMKESGYKYGIIEK